jgi:hypothetical protein
VVLENSRADRGGHDQDHACEDESRAAGRLRGK